MDKAVCRSQNCFGSNGTDIFGIVGVVKALSTFSEQKAWIERTFSLNNEASIKSEILRAYEWTDCLDRKAFHLRINDPRSKFKWNQRHDGTGAWTLYPCTPDLYQRDQVIAASTVIVCAGERDADTMNEWLKETGMYPETVASTPYSGESAVKADIFTLLHGKVRVFVVGDNDKTGEAYRIKVFEFLQGKVGALYLFRIPQEFKDVTEWADHGGTAQDLKHLLAKTTPANSKQLGEIERSTSSVVLTTAATVIPQKTDWAWEGRIPLNTLTVFAGNPGLGKSTITVEKTAQWSKGLVESDLKGRPVDVAIASAEDSFAHTLVPRLMAAGADLTRVHFIEKEKKGERSSISIPKDVPAIEKAMQKHQAKVLVIDPLACHINGGINSWRDTDIRRALSPLAELADTLEAVVLVIVHLNKANYSEALYKVGGSTGIVAAARSVLLVAEDPDDEGGKVLTHLKCNLGPKAVSKKYSIQEQIVWVDGKQINTSSIVWGDDAPELTASSVLSVKKDQEKLSANLEAIKWLEGLLCDLPLSQKRIIEESRKMGIKDRTLHRAKKALGVRSFKNGFGKEGAWTWQIPTKPANGGPELLKDGQYSPLGNLSKTPHEKSKFSNGFSKDCQPQFIGNHSGIIGNDNDTESQKELFAGSEEEVVIDL
ncbi:MAG: AAA family ATPase [Nitrospira sp.]|nr:AAA family ATPase [Nitrospira sp.]